MQEIRFKKTVLNIRHFNISNSVFLDFKVLYEYIKILYTKFHDHILIFLIDIVVAYKTKVEIFLDYQTYPMQEVYPGYLKLNKNNSVPVAIFSKQFFLLVLQLWA